MLLKLPDQHRHPQLFYAPGKVGSVPAEGEMTPLMTAIRNAGRVYSFAGCKTSGYIDLGGCAAGA